MLVKNVKTNETREVKEPGTKALQKVISEGVDKCTGPCRCVVEPDGTCPQGWPSRSLAMGMI